MYIIQTNTMMQVSNPDFQSRMFKIKTQTWDEFKDYILSTEPFTAKLVNGTMDGLTKPENIKSCEVLINDDFHLEVMIDNGAFVYSSKYYLVTDEQFTNLLMNYK